jgi:hypothetical protein
MSTRLRRVARFAIGAAVAIALSLVAFDVYLVRKAFAHDSWISSGGHRNAAGEWCCGEGDCFVIPGKDVEARPDGYHVTLRLAADGQAYRTEIVPFNEAQPSPDGEFWRCKRPDGSRRCFFAPPPTD